MNKERKFKVDLSRLEQLKIDKDIKQLVLNDMKDDIKNINKKYYYATNNNDIIFKRIDIDVNFDVIDYSIFFQVKNIYNEINGKFKHYLYEIVAIRITKLERNSIYEDYKATDLFNNIPAYNIQKYGYVL